MWRPEGHSLCGFGAASRKLLRLSSINLRSRGLGKLEMCEIVPLVAVAATSSHMKFKFPSWKPRFEEEQCRGRWREIVDLLRRLQVMITTNDPATSWGLAIIGNIYSFRFDKLPIDETLRTLYESVCFHREAKHLFWDQNHSKLCSCCRAAERRSSVAGG
jgi:hypothetical protein